jgi:hypothetical protein
MGVKITVIKFAGINYNYIKLKVMITAVKIYS